jgi:hypothetical protein
MYSKYDDTFPLLLQSDSEEWRKVIFLMCDFKSHFGYIYISLVSVHNVIKKLDSNNSMNEVL